MSMINVGSALGLVDLKFERTFVVPKPDAAILANPVGAQLEAYNDHDLARFLSCFADDVVFEDAEGNKLFQGHKQMFRVYSGIFGAKKVSAKVGKTIEAGNWVGHEQVTFGFAGKKSESVIVMYQSDKGIIRRVKLFR